LSDIRDLLALRIKPGAKRSDSDVERWQHHWVQEVQDVRNRGTQSLNVATSEL